MWIAGYEYLFMVSFMHFSRSLDRNGKGFKPKRSSSTCKQLAMQSISFVAVLKKEKNALGFLMFVYSLVRRTIVGKWLVE